MRVVKLQFADKVILNGLDFSVHEQDVLVIMGLSGGGKHLIF